MCTESSGCKRGCGAIRQERWFPEQLTADRGPKAAGRRADTPGRRARAGKAQRPDPKEHGGPGGQSSPVESAVGCRWARRLDSHGQDSRHLHVELCHVLDSVITVLPGAQWSEPYLPMLSRFHPWSWEGNGIPLPDSCLKSTEQTLQTTVHGVAKGPDTTYRLRQQ